MKKSHIFPVTVYHGVVPDNDLLKKTVLPFIEETKDSNKIPLAWFTNKVITSHGNEKIEQTLIKDDNPIGEELKNQYMNVVDDFFDKPSSIRFHSMWYNYYVNGEWQEQHDHLSGADCFITNHFSCIHFLSFDKENHNSVTFIDPLLMIRSSSFEMSNNNYLSKLNPIVDEGDFLMFPSYLSHEVKSGIATPEYPRITISFNVEVMKYGE